MTARTLALEVSDVWKQLGQRLDDAKLQPFSPDGTDYDPIYERRDVEAALVCRWPRQEASEA